MSQCPVRHVQSLTIETRQVEQNPSEAAVLGCGRKQLFHGRSRLVPRLVGFEVLRQSFQCVEMTRLHLQHTLQSSDRRRKLAELVALNARDRQPKRARPIDGPCP